MNKSRPPQGVTARRYHAVALGVSTGGVGALKQLLPALPANFPLPVLIVRHISPDSDDGLARLLDVFANINVKEADEGELAEPGVAYLAPANYHLLINKQRQLELVSDPPVNFARPSVDVLFEAAAAAFGAALIGVVLTGAGQDGARGLKRIQDNGGFVIVQDPHDAEMEAMPESALALLTPDRVVKLAELPALLIELAAVPAGGMLASAPKHRTRGQP